MDGFAFAGEALGGKFYGAGDRKSLSCLHRRLLLWGAVLVVAFTLAYALGGRELLALLTSDRTVIEAAQPYFRFVLLVPACGMLAFVYDGLFIGMTRASAMLLSCFVGAAAFFALYFSLFASLGNDALWYALLAYLLLRGLLLAVVFPHVCAFASSRPSRYN